MTDQIEQESKNVEGELQLPQTVERHFKTLAAMTDFIESFEIQGGAFQLCHVQTLSGEQKDLYVLQYNNKGGN